MTASAPAVGSLRRRNYRFRAALLRCRGRLREPGDFCLSEGSLLDGRFNAPLLDAAAVLVMPRPRNAMEADAQIRTPATEGSCFAEILPDLGEMVLRALATQWGTRSILWPTAATIGELRRVLTVADLRTYSIPSA